MCTLLSSHFLIFGGVVVEASHNATSSRESLEAHDAVSFFTGLELEIAATGAKQGDSFSAPKQTRDFSAMMQLEQLQEQQLQSLELGCLREVESVASQLKAKAMRGGWWAPEMRLRGSLVPRADLMDVMRYDDRV